MLKSIQYELIRIPRYCNSLIIGKLEEAGLHISYSKRRTPRRFKNAGSIYECRQGKISIEFLVISDGFVEETFSQHTSILIFPQTGFLQDIFHRSENRQLRNNVRDILYSLKDDNRTQVVRKLEDTFLEKLKLLQSKYKDQYPHYSFNIWSSGVGSFSPLQRGHNLGIECVFPDAKATQADNIALIIGVAHLTSHHPTLCEAGVSWGAGESPDIAIELIDKAVEFTDESLNDIEKRFNLLQTTFERAIESWGE